MMPGWGIGAGGLSETEIGRVISFLKSTPPGQHKPATELPASLDLSRGDAQRGGRLFARLCVGCHGPGGIGNYAPALANTVFQSTADPAFIYRTISYGRIDAAMPAFRQPGRGGLSDEQILDLVAYVRSLGTRTRSDIAAAASNKTGQKP
jgi:cytochrome c oxidase cbb3-type subunit 3